MSVFDSEEPTVLPPPEAATTAPDVPTAAKPSAKAWAGAGAAAALIVAGGVLFAGRGTETAVLDAETASAGQTTDTANEAGSTDAADVAIDDGTTADASPPAADATGAAPAAPADAERGPRPDGPGHHGGHGTITAIDGTTFTVEHTHPDGTTESVTVTTSDATTYAEAVEGSLADLAVGDSIMVMGRPSDAGVTAGRIVEGAEPKPADADDAYDADRPAGHHGGHAGTITAIDGASITIQTADGESVTVTTTEETTVVQVTAIAFADLAVGDEVGVMGTRSEDGTTVAADAVRVGELAGPGKPGHGPGGGHHGPPPGPGPDQGTNPETDDTTGS
jgi:hypothetical protein